MLVGARINGWHRKKMSSFKHLSGLAPTGSKSQMISFSFFSDFFKNLESTLVSKLYWTKMAIPVIDFSAMGLQNKNQPWAENSNAVKDLAEELYNAFSTVGFVYLKNHGIPQETVRFCSNVCFVVVVVNVFKFKFKNWVKKGL